MFNKKREITHEEALEITHNFGQKCYKKGYKKGYRKGYLKAKLESISCSFGLIAVLAYVHKNLSVDK